MNTLTDCFTDTFNVTQIKNSGQVFVLGKALKGYLYDPLRLVSNVEDEHMVIPLQIDTEFTTEKTWDVVPQCTRTGITTQVKGISPNSKEVIFSHPEVADKLPRHTPAITDFHPVDYLMALGHDCSLKTEDNLIAVRGLPIAHFVLYAHFAVAESMMIVRNRCAEDFEWLFSQKDPKRKFEMRRRLQASTVLTNKNGGCTSNYVDLAWKLTIDGINFRVRLTWIDTAAIHGAATYKDFCDASGVKLDAKDNFTNEEKADMLTMAINRPEEFDSYALGDLHIYDALVGNAKNMEQVYNAAGLEEYTAEPKLTIGATVKDLWTATLMKAVGMKKGSKEYTQFEKEFLTPASAQALRMNTKSTSAMLAKIVGGRCRNNRPTTIKEKALICDLDISGAYGEGQRNQIYPIGKPEIVQYPSNSTVNDYMTIKEFRKIYANDLTSGAWFAIVTTDSELVYRQDFLASWFTKGKAGADVMAKYILSMMSDTEKEGYEDEASFNEEDGNIKIFNHAIHNAVINHDFLDWLDNICGVQQRKELEQQLKVRAAIVYPTSQKCESYEEFEKAHEKHESKNTVKRVKNKSGKKHLRADDGECHSWFYLDLGESIINGLLANRKMYAKKTPLNTLYKLCVNTLYGDMTSKYFKTANVVVGNNITARCRAMAWYMEKGLYGFQTITDGCAFELNRVVHTRAGRRATAAELTNFYRDVQQQNNLRLAPMGGYKRIEHDWLEAYEPDGKRKDKIVLKCIGEDGSITEMVGKDAMNWVDKAAMVHLQGLFPNVSVLHAASTAIKPDMKGGYSLVPQVGQFAFEAKDYYDEIVCHGSSNYLLTNPNGGAPKMRSYETKKEHSSVDLVDDHVVKTNRYDRKSNPATDLFKELEHPTRVARQVPFVKSAILKPGDYKSRLETWEKLGLTPGDNFNKSGLLREFSLSQFTFRTLEQYHAWNQCIEKFKTKYGQTLEQYFTNDDGTLNFEKMIHTVDGLIEDGCVHPFNALDKSEKSKTPHPRYAALLALRDYLNAEV